MEMEIEPLKIEVHAGCIEEVTEDSTNFPYQIINIVCLAQMIREDPSEKINFDELEKRMEVKRLNRFPCVLFKVDNISVILFRNGKLILTGIKTHDQISRLKHLVIQRLQNEGQLEFFDLSVEIQNLVIMTQLGKIVNLELACLTLTNCLYEPEQFPAAIVKPPSGGTFLIFSNSKIIGLGMKSIKMVQKSLQSLISDIFENDLFIEIESHDLNQPKEGFFF